MMLYAYTTWEYMELGAKFFVDVGVNHVIIGSEVTDLTMKEDIYKKLKQWFNVYDNSRFKYPIRAIGGDNTGDGQFAGDIYFMINNYRLIYDPTKVRVTGIMYSDNFDTPWLSNVDKISPVYPATVSNLALSVVPDLIALGTVTAQEVWDYDSNLIGDNTTVGGRQVNDISNIQLLIENLVPESIGTGTQFFVDPINGEDATAVSGQQKTRAWKTVGYALSKAKDNNGDIIWIISPGSQDVVLNEQLVISKNNISIRGQNLGVLFQPTTSGAATITVTGDNVGLYNIIVQTAAGGTDNCIEFTGADFSALRNVRVESATGKGIVYNNCVKGNLLNSFIGYHVSHGIQYNDCVDMNINDNCHIDSNGGDGINLTSTGAGNTHEVIIQNTIIHESGFNTGNGYGVNIGVNCETVQIHSSVKFILNESGDVNDLGITTYYDISSLTTTGIATAVWNRSKTDAEANSGSIGEYVAATASQTSVDAIDVLVNNIDTTTSNIETKVIAIQVDITNIMSVVDDIIKYHKNRSFINKTAFTLTIYEDDGTTPFKVFDLKDDSGVATITSIFERLPQ